MGDYTNRDLKEAFDLLDFRHEGTVDIAESLESLRTLEYDKRYPVIYNFIEAIGEGKFTYEEFERKLTIMLQDIHDDIGLRRMFDLFINNPNKDTIDFDSLKKICKELGETFTDKDAEFIMNEVGDGEKITYNKFQEFMKKKFN